MARSGGTLSCAFAAAFLVALSSCKDDETSNAGTGGNAGAAGTAAAGEQSRAGSAGTQATSHGEGGSAGSDATLPCEEGPETLARPPQGELPCELFPPGYSR